MIESVIAAGLIVLIGCGVIAALMKLNHTVGKLCGEIKGLGRMLANHEQRIQRLEDK